MSQKRQNTFFVSSMDPRSQITTLSHDYAAGHVIPSHFHDRDQLVYASQGVMTIRTSEGTWVVPTRRAVWIPAKIPHTIRMSGTVAMRTLYLKPRLAKTLPRTCCVVHVSALLKELILYACKLGSLHGSVRWQGHLIGVILHQLAATGVVPLQLPNPTESRALRIAKLLSENPADRRTLSALCKSACASKRTIERIFHDDVGMPFAQWRQQLRLMRAMVLLAEGAKVTHAAMESGYSTPSAFISMFRKSMGTTPALYFKANPPDK